MVTKKELEEEIDRLYAKNKWMTQEFEKAYLLDELGKALASIKSLEWLNHNQYNLIKKLQKELDGKDGDKK